MDEKRWSRLGLTDDVIRELYRRVGIYAESRIVPQHREDAVQHGMMLVLEVAAHPPKTYPTGASARLDYLTTVLNNEAMKFVTRKLIPDTNIPLIPE